MISKSHVELLLQQLAWQWTWTGFASMWVPSPISLARTKECGGLQTDINLAYLYTFTINASGAALGNHVDHDSILFHCSNPLYSTPVSISPPKNFHLSPWHFSPSDIFFIQFIQHIPLWLSHYSYPIFVGSGYMKLWYTLVAPPMSPPLWWTIIICKNMRESMLMSVFLYSTERNLMPRYSYYW